MQNQSDIRQQVERAWVDFCFDVAASMYHYRLSVHRWHAANVEFNQWYYSVLHLQRGAERQRGEL